MDSVWFTPAVFALGLFVGAGIVVLVRGLARRDERVADATEGTIPDGVDQVLGALESAGVVLDSSNSVVKASPGVLALGLVTDSVLVHPSLRNVVEELRSSLIPISRDIELPRGPFGGAIVNLGVRASRLGSDYILLIADDHTEATRLDAVRRDFVANISHELKTPIGAISLLADAAGVTRNRRMSRSSRYFRGANHHVDGERL